MSESFNVNNLPKENSKTIKSVISKLFSIAIFFSLMTVVAMSLIACSSSSNYSSSSIPSTDDYIGVWACYKVEVKNTENGKTDFTKSYEKLSDVNEFLVLKENNEVQYIMHIATDNMSVPFIKWENAVGNIVLISDDGECKFIFSHSSEKVLSQEQLIDGILTVNDPTRKCYFEKISNDPSYQPWTTAN